MLFKKIYEFLFVRKPKVKVLSGLIESDNEKYDWLSVNNDPQFNINTKFWIPGWYMLELIVDCEVDFANVSIYVNSGNGFREEERFDLPVRKNVVAKRLIYISIDTSRLRLDPVDFESNFSIKSLCFFWAPASFAHKKMFNKLSNMDPGFDSLSKKSAYEKIKKISKDSGKSWNRVVYDLYNKVFGEYKKVADYSRWVNAIESSDLRLKDIDSIISGFESQPKISIILPVYNVNRKYLRDCIDSVRLQSYSNWQLCIADDSSTLEETIDLLLEIEHTDDRIEIVWRKSNGHISAASNSALELVKGEYVLLLDHDDKLACNALFYIAEEINRHNSVQFIYSDEDKIDADNGRYSPHFKADWNQDLIYSQNYICHLSVFKTDRLIEIGGFRHGVEGSQDHDLVLRFTEGLCAKDIIHIPRILYHWRAIEGSTALNSNEKSYTSIAGLKAVSDVISVDNPQAKVVHGLVENSYRVIWPLPELLPLVSLLIPTRDGIEILKPCVDAILEQTEYKNFEILILDNQTKCSETLKYLDAIERRDSRVQVLRWDFPFNYSAINNFGVRNAKGSIIGLVNNDIEPINSDWLTEMVRQVSRPDIGCVGAKLYYPNDTLQHGGVILGLGGVAGHSHKYFPRNHSGYFFRLKLVQNLSAVTAACMLIRKDVYNKVRGLNETDLTVAFNDVDLCLKVRSAGYRNLWTPYAELYHHESVSRGAENNAKKRARARKEVEYMRKIWKAELDSDPAYNPHLTLAYEDFSLR
ncbi:glycosyltransferase family 2 protein [Amphritea japonica]|uniref:Glycosyl transferase family 2 n=1 Tax=Amphritea japonica ATCC BAA-1530 TaxID=1278309 RepID=A0A7R6SS17_9GAMM|nr:glycosyltransferase family 2 protein [Amphritea japonica]BBB25112.1 glycosyl transferase family 2 [Amphritea japonica ATCC BAA-1530]